MYKWIIEYYYSILVDIFSFIESEEVEYSFLCNVIKNINQFNRYNLYYNI